ncbi:MAG: hypothetical protein LBV26_05825 [Bacteroidales bacterium]|nr:hypothetical protein [Bacteroidales bacterium]
MLLQLNIFFIFSALITCGNLIIAQFLNYGVSAYADDTFYTGGAGVGITNQLSIILLTYPFLLKTKKDILPKIMWYIIYFIGIISVFLIFMVMKRAAIVGLVVGLLVCLLFLSSRINFIKYIIASIFVLYLIFPFFENAFMTRYESRLRQTENIDREGRVVEFLYALDEFKESDTVQKLFGEEIFNTAATFGIKYFDRGRMIHGDITMFFYGSGLVGIIMYILIYAGLFREGVRYYTVLRRLPVIKDLFAVYFAILISYFAVSVTGSGTIGERCLVFLYLGGITGVLRNIILNIKRERINGSISAGIEKQH